MVELASHHRADLIIPARHEVRKRIKISNMDNESAVIRSLT